MSERTIDRTTTSKPVRSRAILRCTHPGECHTAFIPLIHAKGIIARELPIYFLKLHVSASINVDCEICYNPGGTIMIHKRFVSHVSTKRWFWVLTIVTSLLLGFSIGQMVQFREAIAQPQDDRLSQLAEDLDAFKAEHKRIQTRWQSELLAQIVPTLAGESDGVKRQYVDFLEEIGEFRDRCARCYAPRPVQTDTRKIG